MILLKKNKKQEWLIVLTLFSHGFCLPCYPHHDPSFLLCQRLLPLKLIYSYNSVLFYSYQTTGGTCSLCLPWGTPAVTILGSLRARAPTLWDAPTSWWTTRLRQEIRQLRVLSKSHEWQNKMSRILLQGSLFRLYYPCQETDKTEKPDWVPSREYFNGLADFMKINRSLSERIFNYLFGDEKLMFVIHRSFFYVVFVNKRSLLRFTHSIFFLMYDTSNLSYN